jgi:hypothetical protein
MTWLRIAAACRGSPDATTCGITYGVPNLRLLVLFVLAGCRLLPPPAEARVQHGPAFDSQPTTIVALPAVPAECSPAQCDFAGGYHSTGISGHLGFFL